MAVAHYAFYVFYVLGIVFMGIAAIKFKGGDMEAMGKNLGGAVCLFLVPKIVEVIISWAQR
jgi:type IV secretory pathway VirB2 component (pilin)